MTSKKISQAFLSALFSTILLSQGQALADTVVACQNIIKNNLKVEIEKNRIVVDSSSGRFEYRTPGHISQTHLSNSSERVALNIQHYVAGEPMNELLVLNKSGKVIFQEFWKNSKVRSTAFTRDGKHFAFATVGLDNTRVFLFDVDKQAIVKNVIVKKVTPDFLAISDDASRVAIASYDGWLGTTQWNKYRIYIKDYASPTEMSLSPDGSSIRMKNRYGLEFTEKFLEEDPI